MNRERINEGLQKIKKWMPGGAAALLVIGLSIGLWLHLSGQEKLPQTQTEVTSASAASQETGKATPTPPVKAESKAESTASPKPGKATPTPPVKAESEAESATKSTTETVVNSSAPTQTETSKESATQTEKPAPAKEPQTGGATDSSQEETTTPVREKYEDVGNCGKRFATLDEMFTWADDYVYQNRLKFIRLSYWQVGGTTDWSCDYPETRPLYENEYYLNGSVNITYISKPIGTSGLTFSSAFEAEQWFYKERGDQLIKETSNSATDSWRVTGNLDVWSIDAPVAISYTEWVGNSGMTFATQKEAEDYCYDYAKTQGWTAYVNRIGRTRPGGGTILWTCDNPTPTG